MPFDREAFNRVSVNEATHVRLEDGSTHQIASKWGLDHNGRPAKPSSGGFGVVTSSGRRIGMMQAHAYYKEKE